MAFVMPPTNDPMPPHHVPNLRAGNFFNKATGFDYDLSIDPMSPGGGSLRTDFDVWGQLLESAFQDIPILGALDIFKAGSLDSDYAQDGGPIFGLNQKLTNLIAEIAGHDKPLFTLIPKIQADLDVLTDKTKIAVVGTELPYA